MTTASVPKEYWPYAFSTAVYLINRMPTPVLSLEPPFQKLFRQAPNYDKLRVLAPCAFHGCGHTHVTSLMNALNGVFSWDTRKQKVHTIVYISQHAASMSLGMFNLMKMCFHSLRCQRVNVLSMTMKLGSQQHHY